MKSIRYFTVLGAVLLPFVVIGAYGCDGKEATDAVPTAAPTPTPTPTPAPTPAAIVPEEDAGPDADDAGDASDAAKAVGTGDPTGIRKCCNALAQNQKSAPPDQQLAYGAAIAVCNGLVNSPQGRQALSSVRAALKGASAPAACQ